MTAYDEHDEVMQHGIAGGDFDDMDRIDGPIIGIVLSVHPADDRTGNRWFQMLQSDNPEARAPWHEITVWAVQGSAPLSFQIPHVVVMPTGKSSRVGMTEDDLPDVSEDVPQGSTQNEIESFFGVEGHRGRIDTLSGDWVIIDFIGDLVTQGIMRTWYPNPFLNTQAGKIEDGARKRSRRAGTEEKIDQNGDYTLTHRKGHFVQLKGDEITIKHKDGAIVHFDEEGQILIAEKDGTNISVSENRVDVTNGSVSISVAGDDIQILAPNGNASIVAETVDMVGDVSATGGPATTAQSLLTEAYAAGLSGILSPTVAGALETLVKTLTGINFVTDTPINKVLWESLTKLLLALSVELTAAANVPSGPTNTRKTKDFTAS